MFVRLNEMLLTNRSIAMDDETVVTSLKCLLRIKQLNSIMVFIMPLKVIDHPGSISATRKGQILPQLEFPGTNITLYFTFHANHFESNALTFHLTSNPPSTDYPIFAHVELT